MQKTVSIRDLSRSLKSSFSVTKIVNSSFNVSLRSSNIAQEQFIDELNTLFLGLQCWWSEYSKKISFISIFNL